jgi:excisionase family DNA binding protein
MSTSGIGGPSEPTQPPAGGARPVDSPLSEVRFLTVAEVAAVMRVSKMTVYRMVHGGELPAVRVGRSFRVPEKAVHDYLRSAFIEAG